MADFILAAHIRVMGGDAAVAELRKVDAAMNQVGRSTGAGAGSGITAGLREAEKQSSVLAGSLSRVQDAMVRIATYTGITAVAAGFYQAAKGVLDFDQAMTESLAIQSGVTDRMRGEMEDLAKTIAVDLGKAPADVAEGFYFLASAGLNAQQQIAALPQVARFAKAGMMELEEATEMAYDALSALGLKAADPSVQLANLTKLTDVLSRAAVDSQGSIEQFGESIANKAGASMKTFGIPMEEGVALLEVFADQGIKGKVAGERMNMVIRDMALKSLKNADAWKAMGIEVFDSAGNFNSILDIFTQIDRALIDLSPEQRTKALSDLGFTLRDVATIQSLLGRSNDLRDYAERNFGAMGTTAEIAAKQMESMRSKLGQLRAGTIVLGIEGWEKLRSFGDWLSRTFSPALNAVWDAAGRMGGAFRPMVEGLGFLGAGAIGGSLKGIAEAIEFVFEAIGSNKGLAEGLVYALGGLGGAAVLPKVIDLGRTLSGPLFRAIGDVKWAWDGFIQTFRFNQLASSSGAVDALAGAFRGLGVALSRLVVPAGIGAALFLVSEAYQAYREGEQAARDFKATLEKKYDLTHLAGLSAAMRDAQVQFNELAARWDDISTTKKIGLNSGLLEMIDIWGRQRKEMTETKEVQRELDTQYANTAVGLAVLGQAYGGARVNVAKLTEVLARSGVEMDTAKVGQVANQLETMGIKAGIAKIPTEELERTLYQLAQRSGIKMEGPWQEWVPQLADAYAELTRVREVTEGLGGIAEGTGGELSSFEEAMNTLASAASNAEQKVKAFQTILQGLKGQQNIFEAQIAFEESLDGISAALAEVGLNFDITSAEGRKLASAFADSADQARGLAVEIASKQGPQAGAQFLQGARDNIINLARDAGASDAQIATLLANLNLADADFEALLKIVTRTEGPPPEDTKRTLDEMHNKTVEAYIQVTGQGFNEFGVEMNTATQPRTQETSIDLVNYEGAIGAFDALDDPRTQETTVDTPNAAAKKEELDDIAQRRTAEIVAEALTSAARAALHGLTGYQGSAYIDVWYIRRNTPQGGEAIGGQMAQGGILESYAGGGLRERHVAQIAPRGAWRLWAEPETGGEAYIPLAQSKRDRSMAIWEEVGRRFGVGTGGGVAVNMHAPVSVSVAAAPGMDVSALAEAAGQQVASAVNQATSRLLVELRAR